MTRELRRELISASKVSRELILELFILLSQISRELLRDTESCEELEPRLEADEDSEE